MLPCILVVLDIQTTNPTPTLGFMIVMMVIDLVSGTHGGGIMREGEIRPVTLTAGRPGHLDHLVQWLLGLVVREDLGKVKVLG